MDLRALPVQDLGTVRLGKCEDEGTRTDAPQRMASKFSRGS